MSVHNPPSLLRPVPSLLNPRLPDTTCHEEEVREVVSTSGKDNCNKCERITKVKKDCGSKSCPQSPSYEPPQPQPPSTSSSSSSTNSDKKK
ncbi:hypothetical protein N0V85_003359 [Neurospora sp. IMI 360204]|nr:hypothetical protein N0V85_003359 [Neurospora sp. IMI 360204]